MITFAELARRSAKFAVDNSPTILTTLGVVGTITTAYLAGRASFEASDIIRLKEGDDETRGIRLAHNEMMKQRVQLVWKLYIPTATMGAASLLCIVGANRIGSRRAAGLVAAYTLSEKALEQYKAKVVEKIGERKEQQVRDEVIQDQVTATYDPDMEIYGSPEGHLAVDTFSLHYFRTTAEKIQAAVNDFNRIMLSDDGYGSLADFYELLGLPTPAYSSQIGWSLDHGGFLEVEIGGAIGPDNRPILTMQFKREPLPDYSRFR